MFTESHQPLLKIYSTGRYTYTAGIAHPGTCGGFTSEFSVLLFVVVVFEKKGTGCLSHFFLL